MHRLAMSLNGLARGQVSKGLAIDRDRLLARPLASGRARPLTRPLASGHASGQVSSLASGLASGHSSGRARHLASGLATGQASRGLTEENFQLGIVSPIGYFKSPFADILADW